MPVESPPFSFETGAGSSLSHHMLTLIEKARGKDLELGSILTSLSRHSHPMLLVFLSFPLCLPVGIPVLSTTLGLTLSLVGFLLFADRRLWIPDSLAAKSIAYSKLVYVVHRLIRVSGRIERMLVPRLHFFSSNRSVMRLHGLTVMVLGVVAAVPLPLPFNNFVAAFPVLLLALSLLQKDGVWVIISYIAVIPCLIYYGLLIYLGHAGFSRLLGL